MIEPRILEIDSRDGPTMDTRAVVLGSPSGVLAIAAPAPALSAPTIVWEGNITGDGTGPQAAYWVRLYDDGTAYCQCPAQYFRGVLRHDGAFMCKHTRRAQLAVGGGSA